MLLRGSNKKMLWQERKNDEVKLFLNAFYAISMITIKISLTNIQEKS